MVNVTVIPVRKCGTTLIKVIKWYSRRTVADGGLDISSISGLRCRCSQMPCFCHSTCPSPGVVNWALLDPRSRSSLTCVTSTSPSSTVYASLYSLVHKWSCGPYRTVFKCVTRRPQSYRVPDRHLDDPYSNSGLIPWTFATLWTLWCFERHVKPLVPGTYKSKTQAIIPGITTVFLRATPEKAF